MGVSSKDNRRDLPEQATKVNVPLVVQKQRFTSAKQFSKMRKNVPVYGREPGKTRMLTKSPRLKMSLAEKSNLVSEGDVTQPKSNRAQER